MVTVSRFPLTLRGGEGESLSVRQLGASPLECPQAQFGALQVHQGGYGQIELLGDLPNALDHSAMGGVVTVGHVEPENVDPSPDQLPEGLRRVTCGPDGGHDFGFSHQWRLSMHEGAKSERDIDEGARRTTKGHEEN